MWTNGHFWRTFGFGRKQSYHIRYTFGFGVLRLVNSVVAESRLQSFSCGGRECAGRRESLDSLCTDWLYSCLGSWLCCLRLHLVLWALTGWHYNNTINFRFRFSAESKTSAFGRPLIPLHHVRSTLINKLNTGHKPEFLALISYVFFYHSHSE